MVFPIGAILLRYFMRFTNSCIMFQQSGAQIKVYTECCPESTERVVQMIGNADQIASCTGLILDLLSEVS
jgi:hypothetical protein